MSQENRFIPKDYAYANKQKGKEWWDYESVDIVYGK